MPRCATIFNWQQSNAASAEHGVQGGAIDPERKFGLVARMTAMQRLLPLASKSANPLSGAERTFSSVADGATRGVQVKFLGFHR